jgi:KUP system potassium uptake protein
MMQPTSAEPQVAAPAPHPGQEHGHGKGGLLGLVVGSIGVVHGDIGTSPLYALRESLAHQEKAGVLTEEGVIGSISLLIFALIFTVTIKYIFGQALCRAHQTVGECDGLLLHSL